MPSGAPPRPPRRAARRVPCAAGTDATTSEARRSRSARASTRIVGRWPTPRNSTASPRCCATRDQIVVLTGAGISTESGIPDFRGPAGHLDQGSEGRAQGQHPALRGRRRPPSRRVAQPRRQRAVRRRAQRRAPRARRARAEGEPPHAGHAERRRPAPGRGIVACDRHRDPRHRARREVPAVRLARPDGGHARPRACGRGGSRVPRVRRDAEVGDDLVRREPRAPRT